MAPPLGLLNPPPRPPSPPSPGLLPNCTIAPSRMANLISSKTKATDVSGASCRPPAGGRKRVSPRGVGWPQAIAMAVRSAARDEDEVLGVRATCEIRDRRLRRAKDRAERTRLDRAKALAEAERRRQKRAREARSETRAREDQARKQWEEKEKRRQSAAEQRRRLSLTLVQRKKRFEDDRREAALRRRQELERHPRTTTTTARTNPKLSSRVPPSQPALAPSRSFPNRRSKDGVSGEGSRGHWLT